MTHPLSELNKILKEIQEERETVYKNRNVPINELEIMVYCTYTVGMISTSKAAEILDKTAYAFEVGWNDWLDSNITMQQVYEKYLEIVNE